MEELGDSQHNPPGVPPSLNLDVLGFICDFLTEYPDILSLSLTCSVLRPLAVRNLLRNRPVVLKRVDTIFKFQTFILSDTAVRAPHLVALKVDVAHGETDPNPEQSDRAIEALLTILQHAPSLVSLELLSSTNGRPLAYLDDHRVAHAVGKLSTLRELTIGGLTETVDFIGAVRAPLTKLALRFTRPVGGFKEWSLTSLSDALSHIASSLENLTIMDTRVRLECDGPPPSGPLPTFIGIQFHTLRSLTLDCLVVVPHLPLLLDLFPNLDGTLHLSPYIYDVPDSVDYSERYNTFFRTVREQNGTAQRQRTWKGLARLICDVETLFILNLKCPIGLTIVHDCAPHAGPDVGRCLVESLRDHPPVRLNLQVNVLCESEQRSLGGIIPVEAAATLTHLTLCVKYDYDSSPNPAPPESRPVRWDDVWRDTLLPAFERLHSLTHLRLVFHCEAWWRSCNHPKPESGSDPPWTTWQDPFLADLRPTSRFDFPAVAAAIAAALPSLRYCFLTSSAWVAELKGAGVYSVVERWRESRAWRIAYAPGPPSDISLADSNTDAASESDAVDTQDGQYGMRTGEELVALHEDVAETIVEKEDLVLSEEEKIDMRWYESDSGREFGPVG